MPNTVAIGRGPYTSTHGTSRRFAAPHQFDSNRELSGPVADSRRSDETDRIQTFTLLSLSGGWQHLKDFVGYQPLETPQIPVANAKLLEFGDGLIQVVCPGTDMAARAGKNLRYASQGQTHMTIKPPRAHPKCQGSQLATPRFDGKPANRGHRVATPHFPAQQPVELLSLLCLGESVDDPVAAAAALKGHHQAGLLRRSPPARQFQ